MGMKKMTSSNFPTEGNEGAKKKLLRPGARESSSFTTGPENKMTRFTTRHPAFGKLGGREQQD